MLLGEVFERFAHEAPVSVMVRATLENALNPRDLDHLFEDTAQRQYTRTLLFSSVVDLMSTVVCRIRPSINAAYKKHASLLGVTRKAVYDKLDRLEPGIAAALVRHTASALEPVITAMGGDLPPWLPGYRIRIVDGNHLASTEHRLKELRTTGAGALPGHALVVLDPQAMLVTDVVPCEDGHAQERSLLDHILALVRPGDLWIEDRNFCTTGFVFGIVRRRASFVIRQHAGNLPWQFVGKRRSCGRIDTGRVFEQTIRVEHEDGEVLFLRRVTVALDRPTRDGDTEIHILTDLPAKVARAKAIAELYRKRWTIETAFAELEATLHGEVETLGYPKAALFAFCVALVAYNLLSIVKAALRSVHGAKVVTEEVSGYYLADEVAGTYRGMMIAIPEDEWAVFQDLSPVELGQVLQDLARRVRLSEYRKQPRGPKKPQPKRRIEGQQNHVSTAKLLKVRESST
jgi:DDE family transposase